MSFVCPVVEYFDPHGVYPLLSPGLLPRLPLRNLHWESHSGPLRSISYLHIDLVPANQQPRPLSGVENVSTSTLALSRVNSAGSGEDGSKIQNIGSLSSEKVDSQSGQTQTAVKGRRHQIPGLRQTPYLKVLLLRCDDNDTYKSQSRQQVRDWIKEHTQDAKKSASKLSTQDNHDAFEWLVIHVVVPNTAAATQPRTSGKNSDSGTGTPTEKTGVRWRPGGSSTILDKLRTDFNGSSKLGVDRIAQIRIGVNDVPYDLLPRVVPAIPGSYTETPEDNENSWIDLITKFKALILSSFDMRVTQYEEDIREKDAQRSLRGWNFCTFFMLKEGLARGFESVGLVEDALVGYDELAVGLDAIIREQQTEGSWYGGALLPYTEDLKTQVERAKAAALKELGRETGSEETIDLQSIGTHGDGDTHEIPLSAIKKNYRELILSNDISVFDFRCYLFARQLALLLRLANASSSRDELLAKLKEQRESTLLGVAARVPPAQPDQDTENLTVLAEVCKRSIAFISSISGVMRDDIWAAYLPNKKDSSVDESVVQNMNDDPLMKEVIDNIVSSFTFAITEQILAQTATKALPIPPSTLAPPSSEIDGQKASIPEPKTMMHPARNSSLGLPAAREPLKDPPPSPGIFPSGRPDANPFLKSGLEDLAGYRAELYLVSRSVLERLGSERGWSVGWDHVDSLKHGNAADMEDVNLDDPNNSTDNSQVNKADFHHFLHGINSKLLRTALDNKDDFYRLHETLTDKALRHYTVANRTQSVQSSMADLAVLKFYLEDYGAAASYFYRMTQFYSEGGWTQIELAILVMYAKCLKELQRKEDYVRIVLKLLEKTAAIEREKLAYKLALKLGKGDFSTLLEGVELREPYLEELMDISKTLSHKTNVSVQAFFASVEIDATPRYHPEMDSFALQIHLQYLLPQDFSIERARIRVIPVGGENREIWLESDDGVICKKGKVKLQVQGNTIIAGTYVVSHVILQSGNIVMQYVHDTNLQAGKGVPFFKCPKLLLYRRPQAFGIRVFPSKTMYLNKTRSLELELSSGWNDITRGDLHIRSGTAGLRVHTGEAEVISEDFQISKKADAGVINFGALATESIAKIRIPFSLEHEVGDISLKIELSYTTDKGEFSSAVNASLSTTLPLGVNVQDVFKHKALFSRFTISSASSSPLRLLQSNLESSLVFEAHCGVPLAKPATIFPKQSASMLYKITKSPSAPSSLQKGQKASLSLVLLYTCLEEEIDYAVTASLKEAFADTSLHPYIQLVTSTVISQLRARISPYDLEQTAILNELRTSLLADVKWYDHFAGLGRCLESNKETATLLAEQLVKWQRQNHSIPLVPIDLDDQSLPHYRSIVIPVDVPAVAVVHTTDLQIQKRLDPASFSATIALNDPVPAVLELKFTRDWDTEYLTSGPKENAQQDLNFHYEITAPPDTWLISGRRKGHFTVPPASTPAPKLLFPLVLVPLREGNLPYPTVEVRYIANYAMKAASPTIGAKDGKGDAPAVTCEMDNKNSGEIIRVVRDARRTTVSLDASGPQGGAWLLETERRVTDSV
ncbi:TMEM1 family protein-like protein [Xylogone sp. PMI_703]|nr:TMEM1 family protein-like protein [Xylogone sp. PMI_703]